MRCRWEMSRWDKIAHCHAVFTVLKVYLCLVGGGLTLSLCCGMSVALIRFSKKVETVSASLHLMNESHVSFTFQLFCFSVNSLLLLWKKKNPWQLYSLPLKPSQSVVASFCWCGAGEGVTHHCGADLGNITVLVKPTMTPSIVWMGSVGHMVSPRPLPLWRHAKWFCTKLGITVYFYAAFVYGWVSVLGWLQCLSGSHCFFFYVSVQATSVAEGIMSFFFSVWLSVHLSVSFSWTRYLWNSLREFLRIFHKCQLDVEDELITFKWSKVTVTSRNIFLAKNQEFIH